MHSMMNEMLFCNLIICILFSSKFTHVFAPVILSAEQHTSLPRSTYIHPQRTGNGTGNDSMWTLLMPYAALG